MLQYAKNINNIISSFGIQILHAFVGELSIFKTEIDLDFRRSLEEI